MAEIEAIEPNGFFVISTFSGCGGSCLGYRMSGFRVLWANEFIPAAREAYKLNHPASILDSRDIRQVQPREILDAIGLGIGELDLLDGSPPCASFSTAGKRESGWGKVKAYSDTKQRTDDLFFEYARLLKGLQPKTFVAENVSGLVKGTAKGYFLEILKALKACGYKVQAKILDAQWLGVPQMRQRLIFVGVREDLNLNPAFPKPLPYRYSVREALPWIAKVMGGNGACSLEAKSGEFSIAEPTPTILAGGTRDRTDQFWVEAEAPQGFMVPSASNGHILAGRRPAWPIETSPAPTVVVTCGEPYVIPSLDRPTERRKFSIAELKRICAFPDNFQLTGTYAQQWERLGRAVPPVMMSHIASAVRDGVLCRIAH